MSINRIFIILLVALFASCSCDESQSCGGLTAAGLNIMPLNLAGSTFKTPNDSVITIFSRSLQIQGSTNEDCSSSGLGGCDCPDCPERSGLVRYALDGVASTEFIENKIKAGTTYRGVFYPNDTSIFETLIRNEEVYTVELDEPEQGQPVLKVDFLGFSYVFTVGVINGAYNLVSNTQNPNIELLASFTTPEKTYNNVFVIDKEASRFTEKSDYFNQLYYSTNEGVIAFESSNGHLFSLIKK